MARKIRYRIGDIVAIPIGDHGVSYARIFRDATLAVLDCFSSEILEADELPPARPVFFAAFFDDAIVDGTWPIVGHQDFENDDEAWPPPRMVRDVLDPTRFRIYERGEIREATSEEVEYLEPASIYKPDQLVEKIRKEGHSNSK